MSVSIHVYLFPRTRATKFSLGSKLAFEALAIDSNNSLNEFWIELQSPTRGWSWGGQAWLSSDPFNGSNPNSNGTISVKGGTFGPFDEEGTWILRATCDTKSAPGQWFVSEELQLTFQKDYVPEPELPEVVVVPGGSDGGSDGGASGGGDTPPPPVDTPPGTLPLPPVYSGGPISLALFGDSIWTDKGSGNPADLIAAKATTLLGTSVTLVSNQSVSGASSRYIVQTPGVLSSAVSAIQASGANITLVRFGHNDPKEGVQVPKEEFKTNMQTICSALVAAGQKVILNYPLYVQIGSYSNLWTREDLELMETYLPQLDSICDQVNIIQGDTSSWVHFLNHPDQQFDGVHPWMDGIDAVATCDATGMVYALAPVGTLPDYIDGSGNILPTGFANYFKVDDPRAFSKHFGPTWQDLHGSDPEDRETIYTKVLKWDNQIYDRLGEGVPVPPIDGSLGNPGHDMHPVTCAAQVVPRTDGPTHPAVDPGVNNFIFGYPNDCVDPYDPANNADDYATRVLLMLDHRQRTIRLNDDYWMRLQGGDYNSDFGTVISRSSNPILFSHNDRYQGQAQYNLCFNLRPARNAGGFPYDPSPGSAWSLYAPTYKRQDPYGAAGQPPAVALGSAPTRPIAAVRCGMNTNCQEALIADAFGMITTQPGPTSRGDYAYPIPATAMHPGELIAGMHVSTMNEFAAVIVWDTNINRCKIVIFALQGWGLRNHSPPYYGFANEGSWTGIRRIDEFVPVMKACTGVCIATDATLKPVQPDPGEINLADAGQRASYRNSSLDNSGIYSSFAKAGCIGLISKKENKFELYDFSAYIADLWASYTEADQTTWQATFDAMNAGTFPKNFSGPRAAFAPTLVYSATIQSPTCLLASGGLTNTHFGDWSGDFEKMMIGTESGLVHVCSIAPFMDRYSFGPFKTNAPVIYGQFQVGRPNCNLTQLLWTRWDAYYGQVTAANVMALNHDPAAFGQTFFAVARADRAVYAYCTRWNGSTVIAGQYRKITDVRINDPVSACVDTRNPGLKIADYSQGMVHGVQLYGVGRGAIYDSERGNAVVYAGAYFPSNPSGTGNEWSYTSRFRTCGSPFMINEDNINTIIGFLIGAFSLIHAAISFIA